MRIVAGKHKGRTLAVPVGTGIRPTSDMVRESLFNTLTHGSYGVAKESVFDNARVLDAFAGSGSLGFESLSRGASECVFMENAKAALKVINENSISLGETSSVLVLRTDVTCPPPAAKPVDLLFLDPPYNAKLLKPALRGLLDANWVGTGTVCCVESDARDEFETLPKMQLLLNRRYGRTRIVILRSCC